GGSAVASRARSARRPVMDPMPRTPVGPGARTRYRSSSRGCSASLDPGLCLVQGAEIPSNLELPVLDPHLRLVDLSVLRIQDGPALVAISARAEVADDDEPDDGLVLVGARALGARLRLALVVVGLGQTDDLAEELAALLVELHLGLDLAALVVDGVPFTGQRFG